MPRDHPVPGIGDPDQRPGQIIVAVAHGFVEPANEGPLGKLKNVFAAPEHFHPSLKGLSYRFPVSPYHKDFRTQRAKYPTCRESPDDNVSRDGGGARLNIFHALPVCSPSPGKAKKPVKLSLTHGDELWPTIRGRRPWRKPGRSCRGILGILMGCGSPIPWPISVFPDVTKKMATMFQ